MSKIKHHTLRALRALALAGALLATTLPGSGSSGTVLGAALAQTDTCGAASLAAAWSQRAALPQATIDSGLWYQQAWNGGWGPRAATYPTGTAPAGCDALAWQRARVIAVAQRYLGLPYRHHHVPAWDPAAGLVGAPDAGTGLDCSNFTAWVYNYGLGIRFTSEVQDQADGPKAPGRVLAPDEP